MKSSPVLLLRQAHRITLWEGPLWIVAAGLALDVIIARRGADEPWQIALCGATIAGAVLLRLARKQTLNGTARLLDASAHSQNRFEALVEVTDRADPLASALREEATQGLSGLSLPRPYGWYSAFAVIALLLALRILAPAPSQTVSLPTAATPPAAAARAGHAELSQPVPIPPASLRWLSPETSIQAVPEETIPLDAEAASTTGLDRFVLQVSVNGTPQPPMPVPGARSAGKASVSVDLPLARFRTEPSQFVSYYLSAERLAPKGTTPSPAWPMVFSPLQLIQIRGPLVEFRSSLSGTDVSSVANEALGSALRQIEKAEEAILSEIFALAHPAPFEDASRERSSLDQIAAEQARISADLKAAIASSGAEELPSGLRNRLAQIQAFSEKAAAALAAHDLAGAAQAAEKALSGLLPAQSALAPDSPKAGPTGPTAPLAVSAGTAAAAKPISEALLVKFAKVQSALADRLSRGDSETGVFARQYGLARELAQAGAGSGLPSDIVAKIQAAAAEAEASAGQINAGDPVAAEEPAARAAMALNQAVKGLASDAHSDATATLAQVQRLLIRASDAVVSPEKSSEGATKALALTQAARKALSSSAGQLKTRADQQAADQDIREMTSGKFVSGGDESEVAEKKAVDSLGAPPGLEDNARDLDDLDGEIAKSRIESDLTKLIEAGANAQQPDKDAARRKLLELARKAAGRFSLSGTPENIAAAALKNLRADNAKAKNAAQAGPADLENLAVDATAQMQIAEEAVAQTARGSASSKKDQDSSRSGDGAGSKPGSASGGNSGGDKPANSDGDSSSNSANGGGSESSGSAASSSAGGGGPGSGSGQSSGAGTQTGAEGSAASGGAAANAGLTGLAPVSNSGGFGLPSADDDGGRDPTTHPPSSSLIKSVSRKEIPGEDKPHASPDDLGTGGRIKLSLSGARAPALDPAEIHFGAGTQASTSPSLQDTVGKQMSAADLLSQQISEVIQRLQSYAPAAPRTEILATADGSQAPPDYRAAVADYFESLAKASSPEAPTSP